MIGQKGYKLLQKSERRYHQIFELSPEGIIIVDSAGIIQEVNPAICAMLGYGTEELIGSYGRRLVAPESPYLFDDFMDSTCQIFVQEAVAIRKDGSRVTTEVRGVPIRLKGEPHLLSFVRDISERKLAEEALQFKNAVLSTQQEASLEGLLVVDGKGEVISYNQRFMAMWGISQDLMASGSDHLILQSVLKKLAEPEEFLNRVKYLNEHAAVKDQDEVLLVDGRIFERYSAPMYGPEKKNYGRIWYFRDITERKSREELLRESEQRYRRIFESSLDGMIILDSAGVMREVNPAACAMLGYEAQDLIGLHGKKLPTSEFHCVFDEFKRTVLNNRTFAAEAVNIRRDGSRMEIEVRGAPIRFKGKPHILGIIRDVTQLKRTGAELRFKNAVLSTQQEASLDGILVVDGRGEIVSHNQRFMEMWGVSSALMASGSNADVLQSVMNKLVEPEAFLERVNFLYQHTTIKDLDQILLVDGRTFDRYSAPMFGPKGRYYGRVWYFRDITERKRREELLRESEQRYRTLVEDMPAMICRFLPDGTLTFVNNSYCDFFGEKRDYLIGQDFFLFIPDEDKERVRHHLIALNEETPIKTYEHRVISPDGTIGWQEWTDRALFDDRGHVVEYQSIGRDISQIKLAQLEREKAEKQLQQSQKMEALGTLAGGIAHDFNNILGAIIGYSNLAVTDVKKEDPVSYYLEQIERGGYRARDLVKQILAFSRHAEQEKRPIKIGPLIKETIKLLRASLPSTIHIRTDIATDADTVMADATRIHQIIMNLCTNAGHAMGVKGGLLQVSLFEADLDAHSSLVHPDLHEGPYLRLEVCDTGRGIAPEMLELIFDPYFTTKGKGEGTGLGLAMVHGIVKNHGGAVTVQSDPGKCTVFHVYLPRIMSLSQQMRPDESVVSGGGERILFIDDEEALVELAGHVLDRLGYQVVTRTNSMEALELFREQPERFHVVITDLTMPDLTGDQLAREIMAIRPDIPVVLCTGFRERVDLEKAERLGISEILYKPMTISDLGRSIRRVLDKES